MKRNLDLIRHILLLRESSDSYKMSLDSFANEQFSTREVSYHINLLLDSDYVVADRFADFVRDRNPYDSFIVYRLTSLGHDYLDSVRDENIYSKTKIKLGNLAYSVSLDIVKSVAESFIKSQLGI